MEAFARWPHKLLGLDPGPGVRRVAKGEEEWGRREARERDEEGGIERREEGGMAGEEVGGGRVTKTSSP